MVKYFFDIKNGDGDTTDDTGVEFATEEQVEHELARILSDVVREEVVGEKQGQVVVTVRDESGQERFKGSLVFSLEPIGAGSVDGLSLISPASLEHFQQKCVAVCVRKCVKTNNESVFAIPRKAATR